MTSLLYSCLVWWKDTHNLSITILRGQRYEWKQNCKHILFCQRRNSVTIQDAMLTSAYSHRTKNINFFYETRSWRNKRTVTKYAYATEVQDKVTLLGCCDLCFRFPVSSWVCKGEYKTQLETQVYPWTNQHSRRCWWRCRRRRRRWRSWGRRRRRRGRSKWGRRLRHHISHTATRLDGLCEFSRQLSFWSMCLDQNFCVWGWYSHTQWLRNKVLLKTPYSMTYCGI